MNCHISWNILVKRNALKILKQNKMTKYVPTNGKIQQVFDGIKDQSLEEYAPGELLSSNSVASVQQMTVN